MRPDVNKPVGNPKLSALFQELKSADGFGRQAATGEPFYRRKRGLFG
ncbi:MAG: hypothetical protein K6A97_03885 [Lachnospiraceae bacterium]|nr:hypothetical protein [Lachnospiraceae bacterium]